MTARPVIGRSEGQRFVAGTLSNLLSVYRRTRRRPAKAECYTIPPPPLTEQERRILFNGARWNAQKLMRLPAGRFVAAVNLILLNPSAYTTIDRRAMVVFDDPTPSAETESKAWFTG